MSFSVPLLGFTGRDVPLDGGNADDDAGGVLDRRRVSEISMLLPSFRHADGFVALDPLAAFICSYICGNS